MPTTQTMMTRSELERKSWSITCRSLRGRICLRWTILEICSRLLKRLRKTRLTPCMQRAWSSLRSITIYACSRRASSRSLKDWLTIVTCLILASRKKKLLKLPKQALQVNDLEALLEAKKTAKAVSWVLQPMLQKLVPLLWPWATRARSRRSVKSKPFSISTWAQWELQIQRSSASTTLSIS